MTVLIIFIGLIIGINFIPKLTNKNYPYAEKIILKFLIISGIIFLTFGLLEGYGYKVKGQHSFSIICLIFIVFSFLFFALFKNTKKKILIVLLLIPLIFLSISFMAFSKVKKEFQIDSKTKIIVTSGGFLSCGENIEISKSKFVLFNKVAVNLTKICLTGIEKIEVKKLDNVKAEFLIFHNGQNDSENPYELNVVRENVW